MVARIHNVGRVFEEVTPSDTVGMVRGAADSFFVGGAGDLSIVGEEGDVITITSDASTIIPLGSKRVNATGTTATGIVALYGGVVEFTPIPGVGGFDDGFDDGFDT